jgi:hypothetical protein
MSDVPEELADVRPSDLMLELRGKTAEEADAHLKRLVVENRDGVFISLNDAYRAYHELHPEIADGWMREAEERKQARARAWITDRLGPLPWRLDELRECVISATGSISRMEVEAIGLFDFSTEFRDAVKAELMKEVADG